MRYQILKPNQPLDPRRLELGSLEALTNRAPVIAECATEAECAAQARRLLPDAIAMVFLLEIGAGKSIVLGLTAREEDRQGVQADGEIPFALLVYATTENAMERQRMRRGEPPFTEAQWKLRPVCPDLYRTEEVELRATDLRVPAFTTARIGSHNGRLTIYVEIGGIEMSMTFADPDLEIGLRAGHGAVSAV